MASTVSEEQIIDKLAVHAGAITGVNNAYGFAENPDNVSGKTPCIMFWANFETEPTAHYNRWTNNLAVRGVLFVAAFADKGGRLAFHENTAIPFGMRFRQKFQDADVVKDLLSLGVQRAYLRAGQYGVGGQLLTVGDKPYIGWVFDWDFAETA